MRSSNTGISLCLAAAATLAAAVASAQVTPPAAAESYGTQDYTVTYVPGTAFYPGRSNQGYYTSGSQGRFGDVNVEMDWYATVDIPQGALVEYIGLNNYNDGTPGVLTLKLMQRDSAGNLSTYGTLPNTAHASWSTDRNVSTIGHVWQDPGPATLNVHALSSANMQFIGYAEVWWFRTVSYPPATPTFNDVNVSNPYFQYVEALAKSGITAGCGGGNYCPNNPLTRGQMAVFLAKALGLHWGTPVP